MMCFVTACGEEQCDLINAISIGLEVCADTTPASEPRFGEACGEYPQLCVPLERGWDCLTTASRPGTCTIDTIVDGAPVTYEVEVVWKQAGPCELTNPLPLDCCQTIVLGSCGSIDDPPG